LPCADAGGTFSPRAVPLWEREAGVDVLAELRKGTDLKFGVISMKSKVFARTGCLVAILALVLGTCALAEDSRHVTFRGVMNDYTPASAPVSGPWEVRGSWWLTVKGRSGHADFSAALTMERSDLGAVQNAPPSSATPPPPPLDDPKNRSAHTHHITLVNGEVTETATGFQVTGPAAITKDGAWPPPFGTILPVLTIEITGGTGENSVRFSNITVLFGTPADKHFGVAPLLGVVRSVEYGDAHPR
jgi:hypothetical protein